MTPGWPTILHVDDDTGDRELLQYALESLELKINLQTAENGQAAADYLSGKAGYSDRQLFPLPSIVLLDLKMPIMNGFEFLQWLRRQEQIKWLPVVIFTASDSPQDMKQGYDLGANSLIVKPTAYKDLVECIRELIHYWFERNRQPEW
jgi:CheY-like chemotaxis protein